MTDSLVHVVSSAIESGKLTDSPLLGILRDEGKDLDELQTIDDFDLDNLKNEIERIEDLAQKANVPDQGLHEYNAAVIAAAVAILVAGVTNQSPAALHCVARVCRRVFGLFRLKLDLGEIQQYRLYRYAYETSRGAEGFADDVVLELRNADQGELSKDASGK